jgi:hypothetical protein
MVAAMEDAMVLQDEALRSGSYRHELDDGAGHRTLPMVMAGAMEDLDKALAALKRVSLVGILQPQARRRQRVRQLMEPSTMSLGTSMVLCLHLMV